VYRRVVTPDDDRLVQRFEAAYGRRPAGVWRAPGRVNLIGEHTDYNDGFVLPIAIPDAVTVAAAARDDGRVRATSLQAEGELDVLVASLAPGADRGWSAYVAGVAWALAEAGVPVPGADLVLDGRVPLGAGLSSSAALECAVGAALADLAGATVEPMALARLAQHAENDFVGAPTGLMDQAAAVLCTAGNALLFDVRSLATRQVPFRPADAGLTLLVIDTGVRHEHAGGEYGDRRRSCEAACRELGVASLREVSDGGDPDVVERLADDVLRRRARHVVTENARVLAACTALEAGDWAGFGAAMTASHASLRDDYEVSCAELDVAVDAALAGGAVGARMTGGGFGGCAIALVPAGAAGAVTDGVGARYAGHGWKPPVVRAVEPSAGAHRVL
jgi:galactokinase